MEKNSHEVLEREYFVAALFNLICTCVWKILWAVHNIFFWLNTKEGFWREKIYFKDEYGFAIINFEITKMIFCQVLWNFEQILRKNCKNKLS